MLINDIVARADECRALIDAYRARAVCVANTLRCKIPHKKAFFAVLTDERYAGTVHAPTSASSSPRTSRGRAGRRREHARRRTIDLRRTCARPRSLVLKPNDEYGGTGVTLGWETSEARVGRRDRAGAGGAGRTPAAGSRRSGSPSAASPSRSAKRGGVAERDMLVDFAPYVFRGGLAGFLTRLSATGLANVTSGGGQVPAFVVQAGSRSVDADRDRLWTVLTRARRPARATPSNVCLAIQPRRARRADRRRGQPRSRREPRRRARRRRRRRPTAC